MEMEDVVTKLYQSGVPDVIKKIFGYLDYSSIKFSTQVSRSWRTILFFGEVNVWKALWERNTQLPTWKLLHTRAIREGFPLQTDPNWNYRMACQVVGDIQQRLKFNWQNGICTERRTIAYECETDIKCCKIGKTKIVTTLDGKLVILKRWGFDQTEKIGRYDITRRNIGIIQLEIMEPYVVAVTSDKCIYLWDLEKETNVYEFIQPNIVNNSKLAFLCVGLNHDLLITCAYYYRGSDPSVQTLITARQMATTGNQDFPIVDNIELPNFKGGQMFLEGERIVVFKSDWSQVIIISTKPYFHVIRKEPIRLLSDLQPWEMDTPSVYKYHNGWLLQNQSWGPIEILNIDTGRTIEFDHGYHQSTTFDFDDVHIVTCTKWKCDVWNFPQPNSTEICLLYSFQRPYFVLELDTFPWREVDWQIDINDTQMFISLVYTDKTVPKPIHVLIVRDFTIGTELDKSSRVYEKAIKVSTEKIFNNEHMLKISKKNQETYSFEPKNQKDVCWWDQGESYLLAGISLFTLIACWYISYLLFYW